MNKKETYNTYDARKAFAFEMKKRKVLDILKRKKRKVIL